MAAPAQLLSGATVRRGFLVVLAILLLAALGRVLIDRAPPPPPDRKPTTAAPLTYDAALERARERVAAARQTADAQPADWLPQERLAGAYVTLARLTGSFGDYAAAQAALDAAFARAPPGGGPHLVQASLDMSLHRLAGAQVMLDALDRYAVPPAGAERSEVTGMRGDIAFYRGRYAEAERLYGRDDPFRRAVLLARTGRPDAALREIDALERSFRLPAAQTLSALELQRGGIELQRGDWPAATRHFARAEALFPGAWLARAHSAQMLALTGRRAEAIARLAAVAETAGAPEVMDLLAAIYRAQGDGANSRAWSDRAGRIWAQRLAQIPEAAWGHAVEHELTFGDPARALDLARRDYAARPYGGAAVALASAELANNRPAEALRVLKPVLAGPYVSADAHVAAAEAHLRLGDQRAAEKARRAALKLNPHSLDRDAALIWFGH